MFSFDGYFGKVLILPLLQTATFLMVQFLKIFKLNFQKHNIVIFTLITNVKRMPRVCKSALKKHVFYILYSTSTIIIILRGINLKLQSEKIFQGSVSWQKLLQTNGSYKK